MYIQCAWSMAPACLLQMMGVVLRLEGIVICVSSGCNIVGSSLIRLARRVRLKHGSWPKHFHYLFYLPLGTYAFSFYFTSMCDKRSITPIVCWTSFLLCFRCTHDFSVDFLTDKTINVTRFYSIMSLIQVSFYFWIFSKLTLLIMNWNKGRDTGIIRVLAWEQRHFQQLLIRGVQTFCKASQI